MKATLLLFVLSVYIPICIGRNVKALHAYDYVHKPRLVIRGSEFSDEGCEDLPKWKNNCPKWATDEYCKSKFMQHYCRGTCKVCGETVPPPGPIEKKPPAPPAAFCQDYDKRCGFFKRVGLCENPEQREHMAIYCGVTCEMCQAPTPEECYDKFDHCKELKEAGDCSSSDPKKVYEVKTNCLVTCEFCAPDSAP
ncbi:hypothetical protein pdam_00017949 [Pocillopora damicornis]|uniref:ShKT domain-containing protein n=1 Tax=Pocillopora damicornis TaxID=46731 RepID=A0A3M6UUE0_POCDA|nr:uncharacterized protein LOC113684599 [Pocillopora damicornis]RMX57184.1 hypothetical protein pdam_00017949 [Pocillopora damicornis]